MRILKSFAFGAAVFLTASTGSAQTTITDRPFDLTVGESVWGTFLPEYTLGAGSAGGALFQDDLDDVGTMWEVKAVRRFLHTRTSFEARAFYGIAWSDESASITSGNFTNPGTGANTVLGAGQTELESDLDHYGGDLAIKDTWRTRFGGLTAGVAFSYLAFDQDFDVNFSQARLFSESLDSDYVGGKGVFGWDGYVFGRPTNIDVSFGYFDLESDYRLSGPGSSSLATQSLADHASIVEGSWTTWTTFRNLYLGWTIGGTYISDFTTIDHNVGAPATLSTEQAGTLSGKLEILL